MSRPADWHLVGLAADPTPGESWGVRAVATVYATTAQAAAQTRQLIRAVESSSGTGIWHGKAGDKFRTLIAGFPADIQACETSYQTARDAMNWWAGRLEDHQSNADRGLEQARTASSDLQAARTALDAALANARVTSAALNTIERDQIRYARTDPPPGVSAPTPAQVASARRAHTAATDAQRVAGNQVDDAQTRLDAASRMVADAAASYQTDANTTITKMRTAHDQALPENDVWEKIRRSGAWQVLVVIATVVVVIAAIAAFVLTGPIAVIVGVLAVIAGAILAINDVMEYRAGMKSGWEAALSVILTVIPGGVLLKAGKSGLSVAVRLGLRIAPRATTASAAALRAASGAVGGGLLRITRYTEPWVARVNSRLPGGSPLAGPGGYSATQLAARTAGDGPVTFQIRAHWTDDQVAEAARHIDIANSARLEGSLSHVGRVATGGDLRRAADRAVRLERAAARNAGNPYLPGEHVGHGPDTTWTGLPAAPYWQRQTPSVNSSFGRQAQDVPLGHRPTVFRAEMPDGTIITGSTDLIHG